MAMVPDTTAQPRAEKATFLTQVAFIPNLLPKMENQSFEKLLSVRGALSLQAFSLQPHLVSCLRPGPDEEIAWNGFVAVQLPDPITSFSVSIDPDK
jgi:hypothetical protein